MCVSSTRTVQKLAMLGFNTRCDCTWSRVHSPSQMKQACAGRWAKEFAIESDKRYFCQIKKKISLAKLNFYKISFNLRLKHSSILCSVTFQHISDVAPFNDKRRDFETDRKRLVLRVCISAPLFCFFTPLPPPKVASFFVPSISLYTTTKLRKLNLLISVAIPAHFETMSVYHKQMPRPTQITTTEKQPRVTEKSVNCLQ